MSSTHRTDGLIDLSLRWMQPIQQQGRRIPSLSSVRTLSTCCFLVSGVLTEMTQQIHSLRASGVMSSHFANAAASEARVLRKSAGISCTVPAETLFELVPIFTLSPCTPNLGQGYFANPLVQGNYRSLGLGMMHLSLDILLGRPDVFGFHRSLHR